MISVGQREPPSPGQPATVTATISAAATESGVVLQRGCESGRARKIVAGGYRTLLGGSSFSSSGMLIPTTLMLTSTTFLPAM